MPIAAQKKVVVDSASAEKLRSLEGNGIKSKVEWKMEWDLTIITILLFYCTSVVIVLAINSK